MKGMLLAVTAMAVFTAAGAEAQWSPWSTGDPMDDTVRKGIAGAWTLPEQRMPFPYQDTRAIAGLSCDGTGAYFRFTDAPNLVGDETHDGYNSILLRVRFDKKASMLRRFTQVWGGDQLSARSRDIRLGILRHRTMLLEVPWHRAGKVYFRFDLTGSTKAYQSQCPERFQADAKKERRHQRSVRAAEESGRSRDAIWKVFRETYPLGMASTALLKDIEATTGPCGYVTHTYATLKPEGIGVTCSKPGSKGSRFRLWTPDGITFLPAVR